MILLTAALLVAQAAASPSPRPSVPPGAVATVETSLGRIRIALDQEKAPISVANFVKYARAGHYSGTVFHRVIPGFMIQGGGMTAELKEKPTSPPIRNEARNGVRNLRGSIAMARTNDPNSATAQFFISVKDNPSLDFGIQGAGYAVFGQVIDGMDVVDKIVAVPTKTAGPYQNVPVTPVVIKSVRVEGMGAAAAKPAAAGAASPSPRPAPRRAARTGNRRANRSFWSRAERASATRCSVTSADPTWEHVGAGALTRPAALCAATLASKARPPGRGRPGLACCCSGTSFFGDTNTVIAVTTAITSKTLLEAWKAA